MNFFRVLMWKARSLILFYFNSYFSYTLYIYIHFLYVSFT